LLISIISVKDKNTKHNILNRAGRRTTSQRLLLLELIKEQSGHVDAGELYLAARKRHPQISLSTVYRALQLFKQLGLVDEHHLGEEHHHYEAKPDVEHYHLVCLGCGRVEEFRSPLTERLKKEVRQEKQFQVTSGEIHLQGYCPKCQKKAGGSL
jgi:Fur family ferric uptake transcriptional regulator